jgi:hypothetical protein
VANVLVAGPSAFNAAQLRNPLEGVNIGNPAEERVSRVYFPDLHGRVWRLVPDGTSAPAVFSDLSVDGEQPVANSVALLNLDSNGSGTKPHVYVEAGNDNRVPARTTPPRFRMYGLRDEGTTVPPTTLFALDFPDTFRGTTQPATAFSDGGQGRVFFAGTRWTTATDSCVSAFDSVLFALGAATGGAAYDLNASGNDSYVMLSGQRVNAIRVSGGRLVVDQGLNQRNPPPPPAVPTRLLQPPKLQSEVFVREMRTASSVCR